jgi:hypothetical protein
MTPLSYTGFSEVAIVSMVILLIIVQLSKKRADPKS